MKHLFCVVFLVLTLSGCNSKDYDPFNRISKMEYEGHTYLLYVSPAGVVGGMTHDENCKCK